MAPALPLALRRWHCHNSVSPAFDPKPMPFANFLEHVEIPALRTLALVCTVVAACRQAG
jgi:hypothetical protein